MRALVTGATGFLGSYLVERLIADGAEVAAILRPNSDAWRIQHLLPSVTSIYGDLAEMNQYEDAIAQFAPEIIYHLGWEGVENSKRNDASQMEANVGSTVQLAQLAVRIGCRAFVGTGSQAEYGPQNRRLAECAATTPITLYGAAKLAAYHFCRVTLADSRVRFAWLRIFSCYGPKDNPSWLIPSLIESLLSRQRMPLTAGEQLWDYLYAADAARAIALAGTCERVDGVFNLGSGDAVPLKTIVQSIRNSIDASLPLGLGEVPYRRDQVMHLQANIRQLRHATGWKPETSLSEGLNNAIAWIRSTYQNKRLAG